MAGDQNKIEQLCTGTQTISSVYAQNPSKSPGDIAQELYGSHVSPNRSFAIPNMRSLTDHLNSTSQQ